MLRAIILVVAAVLAVAALPAQACAQNDQTAAIWGQNDQTVVIGIGGGGYAARSDDVRGDRPMAESHMYAEWYALEQLGFGVRRTVAIETGFALLAVGAFDVFSFTTDMLTVNWVPLGSEQYARLGLVAGIGRAEYRYEGVVFLLKGSKRKLSTSGMATLAGVFLDWGGDAFGARLGYDAISTRLDDVKVSGSGRLNADASGNSLYLDLRWAF